MKLLRCTVPVFAPLLALLALSGCPEQASNQTLSGIDPASTECSSGIAQIQVGDGFLEVLCGCTSSATAAGVIVGAPIAAPTDFTCHVPVGTMVLWQALGTQLWHQILPLQGSPNTFPGGQLITPDDPVRASVAQFTAAGTYEFYDAIDASIQGEIVVP